jgi:hypothetical protein
VAFVTAALAAPAVTMAVDQGVVITKPSSTEANAENPPEPILQPYEPITGGYTYDNNDTGFLDVNLSVKVRLAPQSTLENILSGRWRPYFAMSTRFGFYWGTQKNSPVVGKSYNPLLLFRYLRSLDKIPSPDGHSYEQSDYIDFIPYAHQSNGQVIHTPQQYAAELEVLKSASFTNNYIHRGWDYVGITWKRTWGSSDVATYLGGAYFLPKGILQGDEDQYHSWEKTSEGKSRSAVDGLWASVELNSCYAHFAVDSTALLSRLNLTLKYLTGYDTPFRYSTGRAELGFQVASLPLALWVQRGYMSSLAMYYQKTSSVGMELRFASF